MNPQLDVKEFEALLIGDRPMIDVRAPIEFERGAFPTAKNLPILNDAEREQVGILYKQAGQSAATQAGHELVGGAVRESRVASWTQYLESNPDACLYCFRGGQRSKIACAWLREVGYQVPRVVGGYKALRGFLLAQLENWSVPEQTIVIGGKTGTGKTILLDAFESSLDLERLAHHRGSAFGKRPGGQPSQIDFENRLAIGLMKIANRHPASLILEDEGKLIGRLRLPDALLTAMSNAELVIIEDGLRNRVDCVHHEYISVQWQEYQSLYPADPMAAYREYLQTALGNISRRLGGVRFKEADRMLQHALARHVQGDTSYHRDWIEYLLREYYDPMYEYQLDRKRHRITFKGTPEEVIDWIRTRIHG